MLPRESRKQKLVFAAIGLLLLGSIGSGLMRHRIDETFGVQTENDSAEESRPSATDEDPPRESAAQTRERAMREWSAVKRDYIRQADSLRARIDAKLCGAYEFGRVSEERAERALRTLERVIDENDAVHAPTALDEAKQSVTLFEESCRWQSGMSHVSAPHVVSASREGVWQPEEGWFWVNSADDSLAVAKRCRRCDGTGSVRGTVRCDACGGLGTRPGFLGGQVDCSACRKSGKVRGMVPCSACNGTGRIVAR